MRAASDETELSEAEIDTILSDAASWAQEEGAPADVSRETEPPKRRPGRPPGSKNKPKLSPAGGPPPRKPARPARRPSTARKPDYATQITQTVQLMGAGLTLASASLKSEALAADALTVMHYSEGLGKSLAPLAEKYPGFAAILGTLDSASPAAMALTVGVPLVLQIAVNHKMMAPIESMGVVSRETILGTAAAGDVSHETEPTP